MVLNGLVVNKSVLVQVMVWRLTATSHYFNQYWPTVWCHATSPGYNELSNCCCLVFLLFLTGKEAQRSMWCWWCSLFGTEMKKNAFSLTGLNLILGLRPANERRRYFVTTSLVSWVQAWNQPWNKNISHAWYWFEIETCDWGYFKFDSQSHQFTIYVKYTLVLLI